MTLQQMKYVIEIAERGSMNEAAKNLFMSQPSLSQAIKDLEDEIGITVFRRSNRGIELTTEGSEFLGYVRQILDQYSLMEDRYQGRGVSENKNENRKPASKNKSEQNGTGGNKSPVKTAEVKTSKAGTPEDISAKIPHIEDTILITHPYGEDFDYASYYRAYAEAWKEFTQ